MGYAFGLEEVNQDFVPDPHITAPRAGHAAFYVPRTAPVRMRLSDNFRSQILTRVVAEC